MVEHFKSKGKNFKPKGENFKFKRRIFKLKGRNFKPKGRKFKSKGREDFFFQTRNWGKIFFSIRKACIKWCSRPSVRPSVSQSSLAELGLPNLYDDFNIQEPVGE